MYRSDNVRTTHASIRWKKHFPRMTSRGASHSSRHGKALGLSFRYLPPARVGLVLERPDVRG